MYSTIIDGKRLGLKEGLIAGFPVFIGYLPVAMAFGLLAKTSGISVLGTALFSLMIFAGASQFMALNLLQAGVAAGEIILATFLLNLRHLLMSASLGARLNEQRASWLPAVAFGITDETFSVAATRQEDLTVEFLIGLEGLSYSAWVGGTVLGYLVGSVLPVSIQSSMGIALYALFVAILIPEVKKFYGFGFLAGGAGLLHLGLTRINLLPAGWNLIAAIVIIAVIGAALSIADPKEAGQ